MATLLDVLLFEGIERGYTTYDQLVNDFGQILIDEKIRIWNEKAEKLVSEFSEKKNEPLVSTFHNNVKRKRKQFKHTKSCPWKK
jgi:hypothetical protein